MVDEVESLTAARAGAMSGKEPSDALRVSRPPRSPSFFGLLRQDPYVTSSTRLTTSRCAGGERAPDTTRQAETSKELPCHDHVQSFRRYRYVPPPPSFTPPSILADT